MKYLKEGSTGPAVVRLRARLDLPASDEFDAETTEAVKGFQAFNDLDPDGIVGPLTRAKLYPKNESTGTKVPAVHLSKKGVNRSQASTRAFPLSENNMPFTDGTPEAVHKIVDWLDVQKSARYRRHRRATYCNIYAYDFAYLMRAFLPRVFWYDRAIKNKNFVAEYARTVHEMNANALWEWFEEFGLSFGWDELKSTSEAQQRANVGDCVIMVAANKNRKSSGHIVCVVPENDEVSGVGSGGITIYPVQSQAGAVNKKYFTGKWWGNMEKLRIYAYTPQID